MENQEIQLPEAESDLQQRLDGFNGEIKPLLEKYEIGLSAIPQFTVDGRVSAKAVVVSTRKPAESIKEA